MSLFGKPPTVGEPAPNFNLQDQDGNFHTLSDYKGQKLVVYFFPKADTPGWVKQACGFRDESEKYKSINIRVLGISYDSKKSLKLFREKYRIPFDFLSDSEKIIGRKYGVNKFLFPSRKTFLIDEDGILVRIIKDVNLNSHPSDVLRAFEKVSIGE